MLQKVVLKVKRSVMIRRDLKVVRHDLFTMETTLKTCSRPLLVVAYFPNDKGGPSSSVLTPLRDDYDIPIPHSNPGFFERNSAGSPEVGSMDSPDSDTISVFSSSSRDSFSEDLLTPVPPDALTTPTLPSKHFVYPVKSQPQGYPPDQPPPLLQPRDSTPLCPLADTPPLLQPRQQKTVQTYDDTPPPLGPRGQQAVPDETPPLLPKKNIQTNNNLTEIANKPVEDFFSKFRKDLDKFGNEQFPLSAPLTSWSVTTTKTVTKTTVINGKTVSSTSSETTKSTSGGGAKRPNSLLSSDQSLNSLMDELGSSLGRRSTVSRPVPVPRKISGDRKSLSIVEDEQLRHARPMAKPRGRTPSTKDSGPPPPPKPPKQHSKSPPPKPRPYSASKQ